jgi:DNA-binding beta-propeller fold protein YncE
MIVNKKSLFAKKEFFKNGLILMILGLSMFIASICNADTFSVATSSNGRVVYFETENGICRSIDEGNTWKKIYTSQAKYPYLYLATSSDGKIVYVKCCLTDNVSIIKIADDDYVKLDIFKNYPIGNAVPVPVPVPVPCSVAMSSDGKIVYVTVMNSETLEGSIMKSKDEGETWQHLQVELLESI